MMERQNATGNAYDIIGCVATRKCRGNAAPRAYVCRMNGMSAIELQRTALRNEMADGRVMRWSEMDGRGISRRVVLGMMESKELVRVDHGLYRLSNAPTDTLSDWDDIAQKYTADGFVICLLTAARHHGLVTHIPSDTWVGFPRGAKPSKPGVRAVEWRRTDASGKPHHLWTEGVEEVEAKGRSYRITGPARTVVDLYRWRTKLPDGERLCLEAIRQYDDRGMSRGALRKVARVFGVSKEISELLMAKSEFTSEC